MFNFSLFPGASLRSILLRTGPSALTLPLQPPLRRSPPAVLQSLARLRSCQSCFTCFVSNGFCNGFSNTRIECARNNHIRAKLALAYE